MQSHGRCLQAKAGRLVRKYWVFFSREFAAMVRHGSPRVAGVFSGRNAPARPKLCEGGFEPISQ
jgi:hypothetical protein